jgi:membrane associated rhomboid family serine protease
VRYWNARQPLLVTYALIGLNVAVFAWVMLGDASAFRSSSTTARQYDLGLSEYFLQQGEWYRMVTSGFLHFGVFHLFLNMLLLFQLGALLEPAIGRARFALLYFAALLGGAAGAMLLQPEAFHGGASGAVFGLMGAAVVGMYQRGVSPLRSGIGITLALNLMITFTIPGISIGGHLGGAVAGGLAALAVLAPSWKGVPHWLTYAAPVAVIVASVAVTVAVV